MKCHADGTEQIHIPAATTGASRTGTERPLLLEESRELRAGPGDIPRSVSKRRLATVRRGVAVSRGRTALGGGHLWMLIEVQVIVPGSNRAVSYSVDRMQWLFPHTDVFLDPGIRATVAECFHLLTVGATSREWRVSRRFSRAAGVSEIPSEPREGRFSCAAAASGRAAACNGCAPRKLIQLNQLRTNRIE